MLVTDVPLVNINHGFWNLVLMMAPIFIENCYIPALTSTDAQRAVASWYLHILNSLLLLLPLQVMFQLMTVDPRITSQADPCCLK